MVSVRNPETEESMHTANVPKVAEIVKLLGGFEPLRGSSGIGGATYVISLDKEVVLMPDDFRPGVTFPDVDDPDHTWKALHITLMWVKPDYYDVEVGLAAKFNGDVFYESQLTFHVPKEGWEDGRWPVHGLLVQVPGMFGHRTMADEGEDQAVEIAQYATESDQSILKAGCLDLARKYAAEHPAPAAV
jgi:hypothetical protein